MTKEVDRTQPRTPSGFSDFGPKGTFRMATVGSAAIDDEPTPIDPPSFAHLEMQAVLDGLGDKEIHRAGVMTEGVNDNAAATSPSARLGEPPLELFEGRPFRLRAGQRIGPYLVTRRINEGGMAEVYEVMHTELDRIFALKILSERYRRHSLVIERFRAEAKVLLSCRANPNVCEVHDVGEDPDLGLFIVMERLNGQTLRQKLDEFIVQNKRIDLAQGVGLALVLADTLDSLHRVGIIHRDVKPENIILEPKAKGGFRFVLIDFGIAKSAHSPSTTQEGQGIGSWLYASPEQAKRRRPTAASDQYALAHVLYELLFEHAFAHAIREQGDHIDFIIGWQISAPVDPPPEPLMPRPLFEIVERALRKDPNERYPSMRDFAAALRGFLASPAAVLPPPAVKVIRRPTIPANHGGQAYPAGKPNAKPLHEVRRPRVKVSPLVLCEEPTLFVSRLGRFVLGDQGVIGGSAEDADIVLAEPSVSSRHCRFSYVTGGALDPVYLLEDLGSRNGFEIEGVPLPMGVARAHEEIHLGNAVAHLLPAGKFVKDGTGYVFQVMDASAEAVAPTRSAAPSPKAAPSPGPPPPEVAAIVSAPPAAPVVAAGTGADDRISNAQVALMERTMARVHRRHGGAPRESAAPAFRSADVAPRALGAKGPTRPPAYAKVPLRLQVAIVAVSAAVMLALVAAILLVSGALGRWTGTGEPPTPIQVPR